MTRYVYKIEQPATPDAWEQAKDRALTIARGKVLASPNDTILVTRYEVHPNHDYGTVFDILSGRRKTHTKEETIFNSKVETKKNDANEKTPIRNLPQW